MNYYTDPYKLKKMPDLVEQFRRFAAYYKKQKEAGAYDQPAYTGQEDSKLTKHFETIKQRNDERGTSYLHPQRY